MADQIALELPPSHKIVTLEIVQLVIISLLLFYSEPVSTNDTGGRGVY